MNEFWCLVEKVAFHDRFLYFVTILTVKYKLFTAKKKYGYSIFTILHFRIFFFQVLQIFVPWCYEVKSKIIEKGAAF